MRDTKPTDEELVLALARGADDFATLACELGTSEGELEEIAAGRLRPQLKERIDQLARAHLDNARRLGCNRAGVAVSTLADLVENKDLSAEIRRRAAHDLLKYAFSEGPRDGQGEGKCAPPALSHEQLERLAVLKGGPEGPS